MDASFPLAIAFFAIVRRTLAASCGTMLDCRQRCNGFAVIMNDTNRKMKLGAFLYPTGHHLGGWRHPLGQADGGMNLRHYLDLARKAEEGRLDFIFFADTLGARDAANVEAWSYSPKYTGQFEPLTLLSAIAVV